MIVCPRCSKDNQDHYKFCLGCGAELPRDQAQPKSFAAPTPPAGVPTAGGNAPAAGGAAPASGGQFGGAAAAPAAPEPAAQPEPPQPAAPAPAAQPAAAPAQPEMIKCPSCGSNVPENFKFCGSCGHDMTAGEAPAPAQPAAAPAAGGAGAATLVLIRPDGTEGDSFPIEGSTVVGRETAGPFASDSYLSPQHAEFTFTDGGLVVKDLDSLNGIYFRIPREQPIALEDHAVFRIGQEILRYEPMPPAQQGQGGETLMGETDPGYVGRVRLVIGRESHGASFCVPPDGIHMGRERGDVIFPEDGYVSGLHCRVHPEGGKIWLTDVGSSNGTFFRVAGEHQVGQGELLLMGQQLFRVDY